MKYNKYFLPNGQQINVKSSFNGFTFTVDEHSSHGSFPPGWSVSLYTENSGNGKPSVDGGGQFLTDSVSFTRPTLLSDVLHLSSMSTPSINDVKPESAITRQVAMILFATFLWYFQEPAPNSHFYTSNQSELSRYITDTAAEWSLRVKGDGILSGKHRMQSLERMGLIATGDPSVGPLQSRETFDEMFISQRAFWQLDPGIFLFTLDPPHFPSGEKEGWASLPSLDAFGRGFPFGAGPNTSGAFIPSFHPPIPLQYKFTDSIRHPVRPRAPRQGEVFYTRFIPSSGQNMTFRIPLILAETSIRSHSTTTEPHDRSGPNLCLDPELMNDLKLLHRWMNRSTSQTGLIQGSSFEVQKENLKSCMSSKSSFPALAFWGSRPVGFFEIFWVLEDRHGRLRGKVEDWDRGFRFFIGDDDFNGSHNLALFLSSVVHYCWLCDQRTYSVLVEVRADNKRYDPLQINGRSCQFSIVEVRISVKPILN